MIARSLGMVYYKVLWMLFCGLVWGGCLFGFVSFLGWVWVLFVCLGDVGVCFFGLFWLDCVLICYCLLMLFWVLVFVVWCDALGLFVNLWFRCCWFC